MVWQSECIAMIMMMMCTCNWLLVNASVTSHHVNYMFPSATMCTHVGLLLTLPYMQPVACMSGTCLTCAQVVALSAQKKGRVEVHRQPTALILYTSNHALWSVGLSLLCRTWHACTSIRSQCQTRRAGAAAASRTRTLICRISQPPSSPSPPPHPAAVHARLNYYTTLHG